MASKAEYLNMMKKLDKESAMRPDEVEEMLPILDDPNLKGLMMPPISARDMDNMLRKADPKSVVREGENVLKGAIGAGMTGNMFDEMKKLDPKSAVREGEIPMSIEIDGKIMMMTPSEIAKMSEVDRNKMRLMSEDMLADLSMADREAVEGLTTMGVSLTDAIKAVMGVSESPASMTEGALGSLPKEKRVIREQEIDPMRGDTTQSLDMQDSINT